MLNQLMPEEYACFATELGNILFNEWLTLTRDNIYYRFIGNTENLHKTFKVRCSSSTFPISTLDYIVPEWRLSDWMNNMKLIG